MNKNNVIRGISLLLAAGVLLTAYGCKGDEEAATTTAPTTLVAGVNQPVIENSTAVIEYTSVNDKGEYVEATKVVQVNDNAVGKLNTSSSFGEDIKDQKEKDKFLARNEDFGIDKDTAQDIVDNAASWTKFSYSVYIANTYASRIAFRKIKAANTENIIIDRDLGCEYGFNPGSGMSISIEGLVKTSAYETEEEIIAELNKTGLQIIYTLVDSADDSVDDWSKVTTAYIPVKITNN